MIPSMKDLLELVKTLKDSKEADLKAQHTGTILALYEKALELREEIDTKDERIKELESILIFRQRMTHRHGVYWIEGDSYPLCPTCWELNGRVIHLDHNAVYEHVARDGWRCHVCGKHNSLSRDLTPKNLKG